ncbi:hypothetical protein ACFWYW_28630 [Nonomuraea sp. NPDC059023]|uniref:hypothetical protein n=1 Tax=unclassified Nonomuraea TaxID=2593643 RepID=UPI0036BB9E17
MLPPLLYATGEELSWLVAVVAIAIVLVLVRVAWCSRWRHCSNGAVTGGCGPPGRFPR